MLNSTNIIRKIILEMAFKGQSGHIACSFSLVELIYTIYSKFIDLNKLKILDPERDYVCLSKGHGVMALYACLYQIGLIQKEDINNYFSEGSTLTGLADAHVPGVEVSGGSLGHGITVATGIALSKKIDNSSSQIFCIIGDGELNEGSAWEAISIAAQHQLKHFLLLIDANSYQAMGKCDSILNMESLSAKFESFNFEVRECDGHNLNTLESTLSALINSESLKPKVLIARTIKGKGISFMENNNTWHYSRLDEKTYQEALNELKQ
jgi:transketolase